MRYNRYGVTYEFYKQVGYAIGAYAAIAAVLAGMVMWLGYDMRRHVQAIQDAKRELLMHESAENQSALLRVQADAAARETPRLLSLLPLQDQLIHFPRESGNLARRHNLELGVLFGASAPSATSTPGTVAFSMTGKGAAVDWLDFLSEIEAGQYFVGIDSLRMASADGTVYDATINGKIFSQ